jgi:hypothetical protein
VIKLLVPFLGCFIDATALIAVLILVALVPSPVTFFPTLAFGP